MPEAGEIAVLAEQLGALLPLTVVHATVGHPKFDAAASAAGHTFVAAATKGKYLLLADESRRTAVLHLGMTGTLRAGESAPGPHQVFSWQSSDGHGLHMSDPRRFGFVDVTDDVDGHGRLGRVGRAPAEPGWLDTIRVKASHSSRAVKQVLLDQTLCAGVGNYMADEATFRARIHPGDLASRLRVDQWACLGDALVDIRGASVAAGGNSFSDFVDLYGQPGRFADELAVYGRKGLPCPGCATRLEFGRIGGRGTTWCPRCQTCDAPPAAQI